MDNWLISLIKKCFDSLHILEFGWIRCKLYNLTFCEELH